MIRAENREFVGKFYRLYNCYTLNEFAEKAHLSPSHICNYERGLYKSSRLDEIYSELQDLMVEAMKEIIGGIENV